MSIELQVLNYNGRHLLEECLPSVVAAAECSSRPCRVTVIDNGSTDDSLRLLAGRFPRIAVVRCRNDGLCSFNNTAAYSQAAVVVLLNNDVRLSANAIDPLVAPLLPDEPSFDRDCVLTAPRCVRFDGRTHEGEKTAVRWRWGLVEGTAFFRGHAAVVERPDWTASAGCVVAVRRDRFVELGGFDPLYLPGRLEDLDLCYRAFQRGWHARYVPEAVAHHLGAASFRRALGTEGCDALALRNTLLFQWKHLRHPWHRLRAAGGIGARTLRDLVSAPFAAPERRWRFCRVLRDAWRVRQAAGLASLNRNASLRRERDFFKRFRPAALARPAHPLSAMIDRNAQPRPPRRLTTEAAA